MNRFASLCLSGRQPRRQVHPAVRPPRAKPTIVALAMRPDLTDARAGVRRRGPAAAVRIEQSIAAAGSPGLPPRLPRHRLRRGARRRRRRRPGGRGRPDPGPLAGLAVSIKDLFDVAGAADPRRLASPWPDAPAAAQDAPGRRAAAPRPAPRSSAAPTCREFAFSGVGINPHHGTPANAATAAARPDAAHPRRLDLRRRGLGRRRRGLGGARLRHRRLDPHPGGAAGPRRLQEHGAAGADRRRRAAVADAGHGLARSRARCATRCCCTRCWPTAQVALAAPAARRAAASPCRAR